jgi:hypothetical protein
VWNIETRRPYFDWEKDQWRCFMTCLECITFPRHVVDAMALAFSSNVIFSMGSFRREIEDPPTMSNKVPKFI